MAEVTLYHWEPNANSGKPMLALMEKGVAFDSHYIDMLNFDQHKPEYLAINPQGTIPAMTHGSHSAEAAMMGLTRTMRYTPAVTMVAATTTSAVEITTFRDSSSSCASSDAESRYER